MWGFAANTHEEISSKNGGEGGSGGQAGAAYDLDFVKRGAGSRSRKDHGSKVDQPLLQRGTPSAPLLSLCCCSPDCPSLAASLLPPPFQEALARWPHDGNKVRPLLPSCLLRV